MVLSKKGWITNLHLWEFFAFFPKRNFLSNVPMATHFPFQFHFYPSPSLYIQMVIHLYVYLRQDIPYPSLVQIEPPSSIDRLAHFQRSLPMQTGKLTFSESLSKRIVNLFKRVFIARAGYIANIHCTLPIPAKWCVFTLLNS